MGLDWWGGKEVGRRFGGSLAFAGGFDFLPSYFFGVGWIRGVVCRIFRLAGRILGGAHGGFAFGRGVVDAGRGRWGLVTCWGLDGGEVIWAGVGDGWWIFWGSGGGEQFLIWQSVSSKMRSLVSGGRSL